ncbi:MAG: MerR family transcriptional regulator [Deltaproteobacteria bacterium]|nr:MerR family transcriptional regulator [Deltaproteobacteria bacterium]
MRKEATMRIGKAAERVGIHVSTVRRLEGRGLIQPRRDWAGHRRFTEADVERLRQLVGVDQKPRRDADDVGCGGRAIT